MVKKDEGFHKWGHSKNGWLITEILTKWMIWGTPSLGNFQMDISPLAKLNYN